MLGTTISHYRILEKLGEGGMGVVYKAADTQLRRTVALKFLSPHVLSSPEGKARFIREAQAAAALDHTNICTVHEIAEADGHTFIAMALVDGCSLREKVASGPLEREQALEIAIQIGLGLHQAHRKGIVHRDINPGNIMVTTESQVKILDFGLARSAEHSRMTKDGVAIGTVAYMSPEQARGEEVDERTDIWSLGVALYEMLTGQLPFRGTGDQAIIYSILKEEPQSMDAPGSEVSPELEGLIAKALAKRPEERYQQIEDLLVALGVSVDVLDYGRPRPARIRGRSARRSRVYLFGSIVAVSLLIAVGLYLSLRPRAPSLGSKSVAVLPLENLVAEGGNEWFSDGMTEDIITQVAKIKDLRVIATTSVMKYKNTEKGLARIARDLGVGTIVKGTVRQAGGRALITTQIIDPFTSELLWAGSFDNAMGDIFAVQTEVALQLAGALKAQLTPDERSRISNVPTGNPEAYELYLKGRYLAAKRDPNEVKKSLAFFEQSIEKDSTYAPPHAGIADHYITLGIYNVVNAEEAFSKAKAAAERALSLDPNLSEAHTVRGAYETMYGWDWARSEREHRRAIELNPGSAWARVWLSLHLRTRGRMDEALAEIQQARELDPLSGLVNSHLGLALVALDRDEEAITVLKGCLEMDPYAVITRRWLGFAYMSHGMFDEAIAELEESQRLAAADEFACTLLGRAYAFAGRRADAERLLERLHALGSDRFTPYGVAAVHASMGQKDSAFVWLDRAYRMRDHWVALNIAVDATDPAWDGLRSDPRYRAVQRKMGLGD
ncbi:protein kinase [Candidatus Eisenbacteria bacterium]|uniref:Protein kinase n=1 Tax=Eiseniibacteriota bacterium TaxID=2212470 RepID=A0ABV6YLR7_UNCEI